jgi:hypothetical protein
MAKAPEQHRIEVPEGCHWNDVIAATKDVGKALKAAFLGIEKTNDRLYEFLEMRHGPIKNAYQTICSSSS